MDQKEAREILKQLMLYTKAKSKFMGMPFEQEGKNHHGPWKGSYPWGTINHYTASNMAVSKRRPLGRLPVLHHRFARGSNYRVGVQFIVWDRLEDRFAEYRDRFDFLNNGQMPGEVSFFGDDLAFWHAGWCNRICYGVEIRNVGQLRKKDGIYFWGKNRHYGRKPIKIGKSYWEPYTLQQMKATLWLHRIMASIHKLYPQWFLGHRHVTNTRIDPGPHFPIHEMREYSLEKKDVPLNSVEFLKEFRDDDKVDDREDPMVSEDSLHQGLYRDDWDGEPNSREYSEFGSDTTDKDSDESIQEKLTSLGYYVGTPQAYADTVRIFRTRWKKRSGSRYVQEIPINSKMDDVAIKKLDFMVRQTDRM